MNIIVKICKMGGGDTGLSIANKKISGRVFSDIMQ